MMIVLNQTRIRNNVFEASLILIIFCTDYDGMGTTNMHENAHEMVVEFSFFENIPFFRFPEAWKI